MNARAMKRLNVGLPNNVIQITAATATLEGILQEYDAILINGGAAQTITLPKPTGSGLEFLIIIGTSQAGQSTTVKRSTSSDTINGGIFINPTNASGGKLFNSASTSNTITYDGANTGGQKYGDYLFFVDLLAGAWFVSGTGTGATPATPFSNT